MRNGAIDTNFGASGVATSRGLWPLDLLPGPSVSAMVVEPNGKITVAGGASSGAVRHLLLARFNPEGTADLSFGASGYVSLAVDGAVHALIAQPDGRLVVAGETAEAATGVGTCITLWRFAGRRHRRSRLRRRRSQPGLCRHARPAPARCCCRPTASSSPPASAAMRGPGTASRS